MELPRPIAASRPPPPVNVVSLNRAKMTYLKYAESKQRYVGARFVMECGKKLELDSVVVCTGCCLFHQFNANASKDTEHAYDQYVSLRSQASFITSSAIPSPTQKFREYYCMAFLILSVGGRLLPLLGE